MRNALTGHSNAKAGSASSEGSACRFTTWSRKGVVGTLGTYPGQERCLSRQVFQLDWVQRLKGTPLKSNQDDREVPGGHQGWPRGVQFPGTPQEPHDEIMLSQGPAATASWWAAIAATYTSKVEGDSLRSNLSCRKESTTPIVHLRGSSRREEHQLVNKLHFSA